MSRTRKHNSRILKRSTQKRKRLKTLLIRTGLTLGLVTLCLWGFSWLWLSDTIQKTTEKVAHALLMQTAQMGFEVQHLHVEGRHYTDSELLRLMVGIQPGDPLLGIAPEEVRDRLAQIAWIKHVTVRRQFPDTLHIALKEKQPLFLWREGDTALALIDTQGAIITRNPDRRFRDLIVVTGEGALNHALDILPLLKAEKDIAQKVDMLVRIGARRWDLVLQNGQRVNLPAGNEALALSRLVALEEAEKVFDKPYAEIDLRPQDRIILVPAQGVTLKQDTQKENLRTEVNL